MFKMDTYFGARWVENNRKGYEKKCQNGQWERKTKKKKKKMKSQKAEWVMKWFGPFKNSSAKATIVALRGDLNFLLSLGGPDVVIMMVL